MSDINIGEKIAQYRKRKGLSIRELAKLANVTPSLLSQIERGLANPSSYSIIYEKRSLSLKRTQILLKINTGVGSF